MWGELSSECGTSCLGASFIWGELSWGELSLGRVVRNRSFNYSPIRSACNSGSGLQKSYYKREVLKSNLAEMGDFSKKQSNLVKPRLMLL